MRVTTRLAPVHGRVPRVQVRQTRRAQLSGSPGAISGRKRRASYGPSPPQDEIDRHVIGDLPLIADESLYQKQLTAGQDIHQSSELAEPLLAHPGRNGNGMR